LPAVSEEFGFTLHDEAGHPGGEIGFTYRAASPADPRRRLELLLVERKLDYRLDLKTNHARVVATTLCLPTTTDDVLPIPPDVPPAHHGETIGWDYELRLVEERLGPDAVWTAPIRVDALPVSHRLVSSEPPSPVTTVGHLLRSAPRARSYTGSESAGELGFLTVGVLVIGAVSIVAGLLTGALVGVLVGGPIVAIGLLIGWVWLRSRRYAIDDVRVHIPDRVARRGQPLTVEVERGSRHRLEVGLEAVEIYLATVGRTRSGIVRSVVERWQPVGDGPIRLLTSVSDPVSYPGEEVALHWFVLVRDASLDTNDANLTTVRHPVALVP
jgi:hypothetical protein